MHGEDILHFHTKHKRRAPQEDLVELPSYSALHSEKVQPLFSIVAEEVGIFVYNVIIWFNLEAGILLHKTGS